MSAPLKLQVHEPGKDVREFDLAGPLELGRQRRGEPDLYARLQGSEPGHTRIIVARHPEDNVARQHVLLEPLPTGGVRLTNTSRAALFHGLNSTLAPGACAELAPPVTFYLAGRTFRVDRAEETDFVMDSLSRESLAPGSQSDSQQPFAPPIDLDPYELTSLVNWLQATLAVIHSAIGSVEFFDKAAQALVEIVGLDAGRVLLREGEGWRAVADFPQGSSADRLARDSVLDKVVGTKRAVWQQPGPNADLKSLVGVQIVIGAPVLDPRREVVGVLYGERWQVEVPTARPVGALEALFVDLLAGGVAAGLARQEKEREAVQRRVKMEQFFTPELAWQLLARPELLKGRDEEVTLLFADVRGYSRLSEKLGPAGTMEWINDVLTELSRCVLAEGGVLVNYIGDELMAMWGAPQTQPDHATRAMRAALAMLGTALPRLNQHWQPRHGAAIGLGVGLNTGTARVGNTGSEYQFKYGPLGNAVNVASRVQGLTKYLRCPLLVTAATWRQLARAGNGSFIARRVVQARLVNIEEPVDLYEVEAATEERRGFFRDAETSLRLLEAGDYPGAVRSAGALLLTSPGDGPLRLTLSRAAALLLDPPPTFDPVWIPPGK